jgi:hypothetical protein
VDEEAIAHARLQSQRERERKIICLIIDLYRYRLNFLRYLNKVIYVRLYQHLINHSVLANQLLVFKGKSSTEKATFNSVNEILEALVQGKW